MVFKYTFFGSNASHAVFRRTAMLLIAACCMVCVSVFCEVSDLLLLMTGLLWASLSLCLCAWLLCLSVCFIKNQLVSIHVSAHVSRSAMLPIATVSHTVSVYMYIFRDVHGLFLLMTHVLWSVCLFVYVLGCFVCLSFSSETSSFLSICFCTCIAVCDAAYCYSVPPSMVCVFVHFPLRVRPISIDDTRIMVSLSVCLCPWLVCMSVISS